MLVLARKIHDLRYFSFRHLVSEHPTLADTVMVDMQHDARCGLAVLVKEPLEHVNDELHRRVVVVEQQNAIKTRSLRLRLGLGDDGRPRAVLALTLSIVPRRTRRPPIARAVYGWLVPGLHGIDVHDIRADGRSARPCVDDLRPPRQESWRKDVQVRC